MLDAVIRFSLRHRLLVLAAATFLLAYGTWQATRLPIDVFPDLNRPRVVIMTEAPGMAPEEVETLVTLPLELVLNGANGVQAVRSSSGPGISVIYVEFDWGTDIYIDRQVVNERLQIVADRMPEGVNPTLAPISSIMGQIMMIGMWSETGETSPMELGTIADWVVRQRLRTIPGVAEVFVMGGERKQFQVLVNPDSLREYGVSLAEVKEAVAAGNRNATGGFLNQQGPYELMVRGLGRAETKADLEQIVVKARDERSVLLSQVARVIEGPQVKRGDASAFVRGADGKWDGGPAVVMMIGKQPQADTRRLTEQIYEALADLDSSLPEDVRVYADLYSQKDFIDRAIENVTEALRDGGLLVVVVLFLFLMNLRTTFITLTAIPLSLAVTAMVFAAFGLGVNTMTLGGLAVAIGELVDDAVVDVENIFRRLRENRSLATPLPPLLVVFRASAEIRNSIVYGTIIVVLAFLPLFALSGVEGRLFAPLGVAYIVSILASLLVSLTVTPVLSYLFLAKTKSVGHEKDGPLLRVLKWVFGGVIRFSLAFPVPVLVVTVGMVAVAGFAVTQRERDFLPPFNEGTVQLNTILQPGTSLATSNVINRQVEERLKAIPDIVVIGRRTGRAEMDEHTNPVGNSELILILDPESPRSREEILNDVRGVTKDIPGVTASAEQPIAHLISHMLSGVRAQVGIKLYGDDLDVLRNKADELKAAIADVPGVTDLMVEPQTSIPQLRIEVDRAALARYGLRPGDVTDFVRTAMNGDVVSEVLLGQRTFDLVVKLDEPFREDRTELERLAVTLPNGGSVPLSSLAKVYESGGPNGVSREQVRRRIVLQCNVTGRGLVDTVNEIKARLSQVPLPTGYFLEYGGQFESEESASRILGVLFVASLVGIFLVLYTMFRSVNLSLQVMAALPMAFIGSVAAIVITRQTLTIANMVGFISLGGIASRNGILLLNHYTHLVRHEGEGWTKEMILRAGLERLAPVLMTALTAAIGLVPLALSAGEPGKEILYPIATVILGGLISSTLLDFFVHPAMFWLFGMRSAAGVVGEDQTEVPLVEESAATPHPPATVGALSDSTSTS
ncbi:MAG: efflux RND transporter permease subunit [Planctomycetaceae bacterium]|nr:efflux RND transporter permease subunit [Planctomycetaceae bacterium]